MVRRPGAIAGTALLVVTIAVLAILLLPGGGTYTVRAVFMDAGQMIPGAEVQVGGRAVGTVSDLRLTRDFQAEAVLKLRADEVEPLHEGTVAAIRAVSLSGVTNRFVELRPGPSSAPAIPDGGVLDEAHTRPIVDLDTVLDSLDPASRRRLRTLVDESREVLRGTAPDANRGLKYLNPAVAQFAALGDEAAHDTAAVGRLVTTGAALARIVAGRSPAVQQGITDTARALRAVASQRRALGDSIGRLPAVLRQASGTLVRTRAALGRLRPALRDLRPVAAPLARVLRLLVPTAREALPAARDLNALLPALRRGLDGLPELERAARPALASTTAGIADSQDIFAGLRQFAPDLLGGAILGVGGTTTSAYDANGHFARLQPIQGVAGTDNVASLFPSLPDRIGAGRTHLTHRCPGAAAPPAADGSNPWTLTPELCDPEQSPR